MAITLAQAKLLTQDKLSMAVIDEFRKDSLLDKMIFDNCVSPVGSTLAYTYDRVTTLATAAFRAINSEYTPQEAVPTQYTAVLKPFGGSFEVDRVIQNHVSGITDQISFQLDQKIKATKALFADTFINGDTAVNAIAFDGLDKAVANSSTDKSPAAAIDLSSTANLTTNANAFMDYLDKLLAELDGTPDIIIVNRYLKAVINGIARRSSFFSTSDVDAFGQPVTKYAGIQITEVGDKPGTSQPIIPIDGTTGATSLFVARIGLDGVHAVSPAGDKVVETYLPDMKLPGAVKKGEVEMIAAMAVKATRSAGKLGNIKL